MREISPAHFMTSEEFLQTKSGEAKELVFKIRNQKEKGLRPKPSETLIDNSLLLTKAKRNLILDKVASLVDENLFGRAEMCIQFADLLHRALSYFQIQSRPVVGTAIYYQSGNEIFRWEHCWVRIGNEVVDGNVDSLYENPEVPKSVKVMPYWGEIRNTPSDRKLRENNSVSLPEDEDVLKIWWPELKIWLDENIIQSKNEIQ